VVPVIPPNSHLTIVTGRADKWVFHRDTRPIPHAIFIQPASAHLDTPGDSEDAIANGVNDAPEPGKGRLPETTPGGRLPAGTGAPRGIRNKVATVLSTAHLIIRQYRTL
jgi:hypothetical protein